MGWKDTSSFRTLLSITALATLIFALGVGEALAQQEVSGVVTDAETQEPLPGVNVIVPGTSEGAVTTSAGQFEIEVPPGTSELQFSFVGYQDKTVEIDGRSTINVVLQPEVEELDEVVVTALGEEQNQRELSYSTVKVEAGEIDQVNEKDFLSSLYGKAPGLQISGNASGGNSNLTIRGAKSLTGSSRPLIVVDGVPLRDSNSGYSTTTWRRQRDYGSPIQDLDPSTIKEVSVLKGARAAALYGAEAANGVILITTKDGSAASDQDGPQVTFTSEADFTRINKTYNFQNQFGSGYDGLVYSGADAEDGFPLVAPSEDMVGEIDCAETPSQCVKGQPQMSGSWGPAYDSQDEVMWWDGQMRPYEAVPNNYYNMFDTPGASLAHTFAISNATETIDYRLSYSRRDRERITHGHQNASHNISLSTKIDLSSSLSANVTANYIKRKQVNPPRRKYNAFTWPRSLKTSLHKENYETENGYYFGWARQQGEFPYWNGAGQNRRGIMRAYYWWNDKNRNERNKDHLIGNVNLRWNPASWVNLEAKAGTDFVYADQLSIRPVRKPPEQTNPNGRYSRNQSITRNNYLEAQARFNYQLTDDVSAETMVGGALQRQFDLFNGAGTDGGLVREGWYSVNNSNKEPNGGTSRGYESTDGVFGSIRLSYRDYLYLDATGRNDWSSTLPPENNSYFYPSVGVSFIFSDALDLSQGTPLTYGKLRANYGIVGRGAARYQANASYRFGSFDGTTTNGFGGTVPPKDLQPEQQKTFEIGLNTAFFSDRLRLDFTYYNERNVDQIVNLDLASSSGANSATVNNGVLVNQGVELTFGATPIQTGDLRWTSTLNLARNWSQIKELATGLEKITHAGIDAQVRIESRVDGEFGAIYAFDHEYSPSGKRIVDGAGYYAKSDSMTKVGNSQPDLTGGFRNSVSYKGFTLSANMDFNIGGDLISMTNYWGKYTGKWKSTLSNRNEELGGIPYYVDDDGNFVRLPSHDADAPGDKEVRHNGIVLDGVKEITNDQGEVVGYEENDQVVPVSYYHLTNFAWRGQGIYANAVKDNSYLKLREVTLSYRLPQSLMSGIPVKNASVTAYGRDLLYLWKAIPNIDPEMSINSSSQLQGFEYMNWPSSRSFGLRVNLTF